MSYTFSDQQSKLSSLLGDPNTSSDDMFPLAQRKKEINRGELRFARDSKIYRNFATGTVSSKQLAVPSDWMETYMLIVNNKVITNDREVSLADWERYYDWAGEDPYYYFWEFSGSKLLKFLASNGINSQTYNWYYFAKPTTELDLDADVSVFPEEYREASVYYAASELMKQIGKTELAVQYLAVYGAFVQNAMDDIAKDHIKKELARPDFGDVGADDDVDRQGQYRIS